MPTSVPCLGFFASGSSQSINKRNADERQQRRNLDPVGVEMPAVNGLRFEKQVIERLVNIARTSANDQS